jgi:hypothetical protein
MATATLSKKLTPLEKLEQKVKQAVADLGTNYQSVREVLAAKKIKGIPEDSEDCPVAHYLSKKFPKALTVSVGEEIQVEFEEGDVEFDTPKPILTFITKFDEKKFKELIHPDYLED